MENAMYSTLDETYIQRNRFSDIRAQVVVVKDHRYLRLCRFYYDHDTHQWLPTNKAIYLTWTAWVALKHALPHIDVMASHYLRRVPGVYKQQSTCSEGYSIKPGRAARNEQGAKAKEECPGPPPTPSSQEVWAKISDHYTTWATIDCIRAHGGTMPNMGDYTARTSSDYTIRRYLSRDQPMSLLYFGPGQPVLDAHGNRVELITADEIKHAIDSGQVRIGSDGKPCIDVYPNGAIVIHH